MAIVPWRPSNLTAGQGAAPLAIDAGTTPRASVTALAVPTASGLPADTGGVLAPLKPYVATPLAAGLAGVARLAPFSVPGAVGIDPTGPVTPAARMVKGKMELSAAGGSEPGALGIAPDAGQGSWSDSRMPFQRAHFIPYAIGGLMSANLGGLGPGGPGQLPESKRDWADAAATHPLAGGMSPDMGDEMRGMRYPTQMTIPQQQPSLAQEFGGPYTTLSGNVLPPEGTDPYGSLPDFLRAPLVGGPAGMSGTPGT